MGRVLGWAVGGGVCGAHLWVWIPGLSEGAAPGGVCLAGSAGVQVRETRAALDGNVTWSPGGGSLGLKLDCEGPAWAVAGCAQRLPRHPARPLRCPPGWGRLLGPGGQAGPEAKQTHWSPGESPRAKQKAARGFGTESLSSPLLALCVCMGGGVPPVPASLGPLLALKSSSGYWLCSGPHQASPPQPQRGAASARAHLRFATRGFVLSSSVVIAVVGPQGSRGLWSGL